MPRVVIDASIARSCGETEDPVSRLSRKLLEEIYNRKSKLILHKDLKREYENHASNFFIKWQSSMIAKKQFSVCQECELEELRDVIQAIDSPKTKRELIKDVHLVEIAIENDKIIFSRDDNAKNYFFGISNEYTPIKTLMWNNPVTDINECIDSLL